MSLWTCFKVLLLLLLLSVIVLKLRVSPFLLTPHAAQKAAWDSTMKVTLAILDPFKKGRSLAAKHSLRSGALHWRPQPETQRRRTE